MKNLIIAITFFLPALSSQAFAEGGADRLQEKNEARVQEAMAAQAKSKNDTQITTKSEDKENTKVDCSTTTAPL
ncbi:MAG: co-regulatory protein PtrA N-terminal domain-containing protein [Pseudomonas sp.]|uniref:co-regulatory protein PtrA N-terminal domain-containing protein n=1 Tax=unclassified Pseudomonas TaxID=196821 RepID=UPI001CFA15F1|nr:co-regulatory protein PtrA N-terminal domain-containing protein [Pseudomonas sp. L5B5]UCZ87557.1 hypothetical protein LGQ10_15050 [Pseudomonas sp. L5B5]